MTTDQTRRRLLAMLAGAGAATLARGPRALAAEPGPETATIRLPRTPAICTMPQMITHELLLAEGFTEIHYVDEAPTAGTAPLGRGEVDLMVQYAATFVDGLDKGETTTVLAGVHAGCIVLFGNERVDGITGLKGKAVAVAGSAARLLYLMAAEVGLDPKKDIRWIVNPKAKPKDLFIDGKIDAILSFPPEVQELRARHIGRVLLDTTLDRPWSQYFCCMLGGNREFVRRYPIATKRAMRAILKAADLCATQPSGAARMLVDDGFYSRYDYAREMLSEVLYQWREYDPEDTIRFYSLRMRDAGFIEAIPQKIIADGTDWRFLNEVKRELKA
jgi:NitT/TauT family transport system substrate-binding protein